jgi:hypothetical protein
MRRDWFYDYTGSPLQSYHLIYDSESENVQFCMSYKVNSNANTIMAHKANLAAFTNYHLEYSYATPEPNVALISSIIP